MKRLIILTAIMLSGCSNSTMPAWRSGEAPHAAGVTPVVVAAAPAAQSDAVTIETLPFRVGVSSVTVENMARAQGCTGGEGASLVTEPGVAEVYRMICSDGRVFRARCDMHQCRPQ
jgi:hypothetical protein